MSRCLFRLLVSSLFSHVLAMTHAQGMILFSSSEWSAVQQKALEYRSTLRDALLADRPIDPVLCDAVIVLQGKGKGFHYAVLNPRERALLCFWLKDYDGLLRDVALGRDAHTGGWAPRTAFCCHSAPDSLEHTLLGLLKEQETRSLSDLEASSRSASDKAFLALYLRSVLAFHDLQGFSTDPMLQATKLFLDEHPGSPYEPYVRRILDQRYERGGVGTGCFFFVGPSFFSGKLSKYFNDTWHIGAELSLSYSKALLIAGFGGGLSRPIKAPFTYNEFDYTRETTTRSGFGHALVGYVVLDNKRIRVAPVAGFGGVGFSANGDNGNVTFPGRQVALDFDWKFFRSEEVWDYPSAFAAKFHESYWALRLRFGYETLFNSNDDATFGGSQVFLRLGLSYFTGNGRRVKTWKH